MNLESRNASLDSPTSSGREGESSDGEYAGCIGEDPNINFLVTKWDNGNPLLLSMDCMPGTRAETSFPSSLETSRASSHSRNTREVIQVVKDRGNEWSDMMLGPIQISETATVGFQFGGLNLWGCGGRWFDCVQLVPLQKLSMSVKQAVDGFAACKKSNFFSRLPELPLRLVKEVRCKYSFG